MVVQKVFLILLALGGRICFSPSCDIIICVRQTTLSPSSSKAGFAGIIFLFIILLILIGVIGAGDFFYVDYQKKQNVYPTVTPYPGKIQTPAVAYGSFTKSKYTVNITLRFMLEGGSVTGVFSGDCNGNISGDYDGKDGGVIEGKAEGSCSPFLIPIPASATFTGKVNQSQKTVPISGNGSAAGFSGSGSMVLHF